MRAVVDTNIWISYLLRPGRDLATAVNTLTDKATLLYSTATIDELADVLSRPKLRRYLTRQTSMEFVATLTATAEYIEVSGTIRASTDPDDDKFLDPAVAGRADLIVSGDRDLLDLNPFRGIAILSPRAALTRLS